MMMKTMSAVDKILEEQAMPSKQITIGCWDMRWKVLRFTEEYSIKIICTLKACFWGDIDQERTISCPVEQADLSTRCSNTLPKWKDLKNKVQLPPGANLTSGAFTGDYRWRSSVVEGYSGVRFSNLGLVLCRHWRKTRLWSPDVEYSVLFSRRVSLQYFILWTRKNRMNCQKYFLESDILPQWRRIFRQCLKRWKVPNFLLNNMDKVLIWSLLICTTII